MKPVLLEIPDNPQDWSAWLERQLVGLDLPDLVEQLSNFLSKDNEDSETTISSLLSSQLPVVLESGLHGLTQKQLGKLMLCPRLLFELQDEILLSGGQYWDDIARETENTERSEQVRVQVMSQVYADALLPVDSIGEPIDELVETIAIEQSTKAPPRWWIPITFAAALLFAVGYWMVRPSPSGWGFDNPAIFAVNLSGSEYLNELADAAGQWFNKQPATESELRKRIVEFERGCNRLLAASHPQLQAADRDWLRERCRIWIGKLDGHLQDLSGNTKTVEEVRAEADQTIRSLQDALRARAAELVGIM